MALHGVAPIYAVRTCLIVALVPLPFHHDHHHTYIPISVSNGLRGTYRRWVLPPVVMPKLPRPTTRKIALMIPPCAVIETSVRRFSMCTLIRGRKPRIYDYGALTRSARILLKNPVQDLAGSLLRAGLCLPLLRPQDILFFKTVFEHEFGKVGRYLGTGSSFVASVLPIFFSHVLQSHQPEAVNNGKRRRRRRFTTKRSRKSSAPLVSSCCVPMRVRFRQR